MSRWIFTGQLTPGWTDVCVYVEKDRETAVCMYICVCMFLMFPSIFALCFPVCYCKCF